MKLLIGKLLNERVYKTKKGFEVRELLVQEEQSFVPTLIQVSPDFVLIKDKNDVVEIPFVVSAWDSRVGKFLSSAVKLKAITSKDLSSNNIKVEVKG